MVEQGLFKARRSRTLSDGRAVWIDGLVKRFGETTALSSIQLDVKPGEFFSLLGPSGCGKTTLLRCIAGFEQPDQGQLEVSGVSMLGVPPYRRPVNTVFQNYALFPHLDVTQNISFGLRMKGMPRKEIAERVGWVLEVINLSGFERRAIDSLSGGQKQRVALARAIVNEPEVLLLDEPLSALDARLRNGLRLELMNLQERLGITFIYVTHDQEEALAMSDRIAVMNHGQIVQIGPPEELYELPRSAFVASFLGESNLFEGTATASQQVATALGVLVTEETLQVGKSYTLSIRPEKLRLSRKHPGGHNVIQARVDDIIYTGVENRYLMQAGNQTLLAYTLNQDLQEVGAEEFTYDEEVFVQLASEKLVVLGVV